MEALQDQTNLVRYRIAIYVVVGLGLMASYAFLRGVTWQGSATLHVVMEAVSTLLALIVGAMALVRYYSKKSNTFLFIGAGFLGTSFLDGYHTLVTSPFFKPLMPSDLPALIPWSWVASRQFLAIFLFLSWLAWLREQRIGEKGQFNELSVYVFTGFFTLLSFAFFAFAPLPRAYYPELMLHRPEELLPALFFLAALVGYLHKGDWKHDVFEHWLVISLVVSVIGQAVFMSFSGSLFDLEFDIAHLLKKVSYICVLTGLLMSMFNAFRQLEKRGDTLSKAKEEVEVVLAELDAQKLAMDAHSIVAVTDTKGIITYANDKFCEVSKYDRDELIGQNHRILKSGYHPESFFTDMFQTISNGETWHGEVKNRTKNGSHYWVDTTIVPFKDEKGKVSQYVAIRSDITARKIIEEVSQRNIALLRTTFDNFSGGISVFNKNLMLQAANPIFYRLLDLSEDEFPIGSPYDEITRFKAERGEYGEGEIDALVDERVKRAKEFEEHSFKRVTPKGICLEVKGRPLPEGGFVTTYMDVTETEEMMTALEDRSNEAIKSAYNLRQAVDAQDQTYHQLVTSVNSMRNGFVIWNGDDQLVLANDAYMGFHHSVRDMLVEGCQFEDMLSAGLDNDIWDLKGQDGQEWLRMQMKRREFDNQEREIQLNDGRQIIITDLILDNGEVISTVIDVTAHRAREKELQDAKERLEQIAYFDTLTGLANRAHCQKDMGEKFTSDDPDNKFAIIQIDLDKFKRVNDTLGHDAGDLLLRTLGERMNLLASEIDGFKSYRWGGDEFIALVDRDDDTDLDAICSELNDMIAIPLKYESATLRPSVSLGVARYPEDAKDLKSLMIFSDLALYRTKELGRDGYHFFTPEMKEKVDTEARIEHELRFAIEANQLELYFQPQLDIDDESITGIEALIRWNHPERGLIGPGEFLSISEATGLAPAIGCKVFEYAMKAARAWIDDGLEFGRLAVNLSPEHLKKGTILDDYFSAMEKYQIESHFLTVEFLESFIFDDPNANITDILHQFRAKNIHVELDDFGTGYASLSHLSTMPITGLKVDKSFVDQITNDPRQRGIVSSLISMSKLMNLHVVCEGVETRQQVEAMTSIGKCSIQGYLVAQPMSFEVMTEWIKNSRNINVLRAGSGTAKKITQF